MNIQAERLFGPVEEADDNFDHIKISIASPEKIRSWSHGEVKRPETINYRTFKPERDGLFCARIFGPIRDYECLCGKYKRMKYKGVICERCGVEVTVSRIRRERMAHIELAAPVAHIWFLRLVPSRISNLLDVSLSEIERILYFERYVVIDAGLTPLEEGRTLSEEEYVATQDEFGEDSFVAMIGAEAIREMLKAIDLESLRVQLRADIAEATTELKLSKFRKRLKLVEDFIDSGNKPEWMVLDAIPVIPPDLRPLVPLDGGRFASSDLNDLYRRVINRNNRLKRLIELRAPDIIVRNEKRMLQESVDALLDNGRRGVTITGNNKRPLKSLSDMLKGKQGRFRQNLLGKRVDYSGRSVIVVGPTLKLHQCGLPKKMALELFKPFIYSLLDARGHSITVKQAKRMVEKERPEVWDVLDEVIREHPVLLNRAPTLHRLGIQAFEPVLVEGKAIQLHPLVCAAFNADFDGDQMAVHVPLSLEAQLEARVLMMSTNNVLHPANGAPIMVPSQDIVLGIYYLSLKEEVKVENPPAFYSLDEIHYALSVKSIGLHDAIRFRVDWIDHDDQPTTSIIETTPGRAIIGNLVPRSKFYGPELFNKILTKKEISKLIDSVYRYCGQKESVIFFDRFMQLGFWHAFRSGISFGKDDMVIPAKKAQIVSATAKITREYEQQYQDGLITRAEKYNKVVDAWDKCKDQVTEEMMKAFSARVVNEELGGKEEMNSIFMMAESGARGSVAQMRQLAAMRGLMSKPSGEIIETPIISNFKEGLTVLEYFNSTHGARKGLADTALKTANSGYLTRRLVDVAQDCIVCEDDCGTIQGITVTALVDSGQEIVSLGDRILGRVLLEDIVDPVTSDILIANGTLIDEAELFLLNGHDIHSARIRSPLTCEIGKGVCAQCYGRDLSKGDLVNYGEAVGIIAAQSIGEPGTQLTMRTFHIGGAATVSEQSLSEATVAGTVEYRNGNVATDSRGNMVVMSGDMTLVIRGPDGAERYTQRLTLGARLQVKEGELVERGKTLVDWDPFSHPILAGADGVVDFEDLVSGFSLSEVQDERTGITRRVVTDWRSRGRGSAMSPAIILRSADGEVIKLDRGGEARYSLPVESIIAVDLKASVKRGDVLARLSLESAKTRDITGGLPRVAELFEARKPKDAAVIASITGTVRLGNDYRSKKKVTLVPDDPSQDSVDYFIAKGRHMYLQDGDRVERGDFLVDGNPSTHDILAIKGVEALAHYMVSEVQEVYRLQGVVINDKHIEVIVRQMMQKVEITFAGDSPFIVGEQVIKPRFLEVNKAVIDAGGEPSRSHPVLLGITKASLQTQSFISAASFQETTKVLSDAAIAGKIDNLEGLKENVIVGRLIPSGTGAAFHRLRRIAVQRDELILEEKKRALEARRVAGIENAEIKSAGIENAGIENAGLENAGLENVASVVEETVDASS